MDFLMEIKMKTTRRSNLVSLFSMCISAEDLIRLNFTLMMKVISFHRMIMDT